jgi:hypothetical protein
VITATELVGAFERNDVARILHDAQQRAVTSFVTAVCAQLPLRDVEATPAERHPLLRLDDRPRETVGVFGRRLEQVERDPLSRLGPDAR